MTEKSRFYPDEFDWWELPESCQKCRQPMHLRSGQEFPFCPNCAIDIRTARSGREVLNALKARVALREAERRNAAQAPADEEDERPFWPDGMAL